MTCVGYNSKIGDGLAVYDILSHTIYIYTPNLLYNRILHHEKVHAKHHSYKLVRALFFRKIAFFVGLAACVFIQLFTSLFIAAIILAVILGLSLAEEFYTQRKTKKWFRDFLQKRSEREIKWDKSVTRMGHGTEFPVETTTRKKELGIEY